MSVRDMTGADPSKVEILIVDDSPVNLHLLLDFLQGPNYEVRAATSGKRALAAVESSPPDLIMLDITMPEMDGYEVCRRLKANPDTTDIPVIFISALDEALDKVKAFQAGGVDYVTKPFQFEEVLARIENQLKIARLQRTMERQNAELARKNEELERKNEELARKNEELAQSYHRSGVIFSALSDVLPGSVLEDKYRIEEKIGSGDNGVVYRAVHLGLDRPIAVKLLRPRAGDTSPEGLERLRIEGIAASRINHPNAVLVLDFGVSSGLAYLVMELLDGRTLRQELDQKGVLALDRCSQILVPICDVLSDAHAAGLVHRELNPDNIYLHQGKDGEVVKVLDFGLGSLHAQETGIDADIFGRGAMINGPLYLSPERLGMAATGPQSDVYSLGVVVFEMLTGRLPFEADEDDPWSIARKHRYDPPPSLISLVPSIPPGIEEIVLRTLAKSPEQRPTAKELANEFVMRMLTAPRRI